VKRFSMIQMCIKSGPCIKCGPLRSGENDVIGAKF
jgi:hypothetical protein